jgi:Fe-S cluster assembly protein SufD
LSAVRPLTIDPTAARADAATPWLTELRDQGLRAFTDLPMPTAKEEVWRYVDLDFDLGDLSLPDGPGSPLAAGPYAVDGIGRGVIVDGFVTGAEGADGITVSPIAAADPGLLSGAADSVIPPDLDRFAAAHHGFGSDGLFVHAAKGVVATGPIVIDVQATTSGALSLPKVLLVAEAQAELSVVVVYRSPDHGLFYVVPHLQATVGDAARLEVTTIQAWGYGTVAVGQQRTVLGRDAYLHHGEAGIGGRLGRLHFFVDIDGPGAHSEITGLYFGEDDQVLDYRAFVTHRAPHTTSNMFLKGAVEDSSH